MRKTLGGCPQRCWFHAFHVNTLSHGHESEERKGVTRKRDPDEKKRKPEALGNVLGAFLKDSKLEERVEAAQVVPEWESLVGMQIASVTKPISVTPDGTLFVAVKTNGWMTELSLMEPQILRALNAKAGRTRVKKIRLQLMR